MLAREYLTWPRANGYRGPYYEFDQWAEERLLGASEIVMECVFQHREGHVCQWTKGEAKKGLVALVRILEYARMRYPDVRRPRVLVPCAALSPCLCAVVSDGIEP